MPAGAFLWGVYIFALSLLGLTSLYCGLLPQFKTIDVGYTGHGCEEDAVLEVYRESAI